MAPNNRLWDDKQESSALDIPIVHGNGSASHHSADDGFTLADVFRCTARHKWKVLCFFCLATVATVAAAIHWPKTYRSEAKLYLRVGRESVGLDPTATLGRGNVGIQVTREEELNTVVEFLRSRALLEKVVDTIGPEVILNPTPEIPSTSGPSWIASLSSTLKDWMNRLTKDVPLSPRERAFNALRTQVDVQNVRKTDVINVTHDGRNPEVSQRIVAALVGLCLDQHVQLNRSPGAHAFLTDEASAMKAELVRTENALRVFKNESGLASPTEQRLALVNQIAHLEAELATTGAAIAATEAENRELSKELASVSPVENLGKSMGNPNYAADGMRQQLYALELKEKELAARVTDKHLELQSVRAQIAAAKPILNALEPTRTQTTTGRNRIHEELRITFLRQSAALASQRARSSKMVTQLAEANHRLTVLNDNEIQIAQLQRDVQILDASYRKYAESREQARLEESLGREKISNITVAQQASISSHPIKPQRSLIVIAGLLASLFGAPCLAIVADHFDSSRKRPTAIEKPLRRPIPASLST
jgi:uncharacterized protein involved in exopolysaccharide biosynthesis